MDQEVKHEYLQCGYILENALAMALFCCIIVNIIFLYQLIHVILSKMFAVLPLLLFRKNQDGVRFKATG